MRVLVADDDTDLLMLARLILQRQGFEVVTAENGAEALNLCKKENFDIVLLDVMMPELDGFETLRHIKKDDATKDLPVVLVSARVTSEDKLHGLEAGAAAYVTKPFDPQFLVDLINKLAIINNDEREQLRHSAIADVRGNEPTSTAQSAQPAEEVKTPEPILRMATVLELAVDAVITVNESQEIVGFNHGAEETFQYLAEEVMGRPLNILIPERSRGVHPKHIENFAKGAQASRLMGHRQEIFGLRKDGTEFPAEASILKTESINGPEFTAILRDVTERHLVESKLHQRIHQQESLAELSQDFLNPLSASFMYEQALATVIKVLKCPYGCVLESDPEISLPIIKATVGWDASRSENEEISEYHRLLADRTLRQGAPIFTSDANSGKEVLNSNRNFDLEIKSIVSVPLMTSNGILGVLQVCSEEAHFFDSEDLPFIKGVANTLAVAVSRQLANERAEHFFESMPDATLIVDKSGDILSANTACESLFGYTSDELLSLNVDDLVPDELRSTHSQSRASYERAPRARPMGAGLSLYARRKDGVHVPVDIMLSPLDGEEGTHTVAAVRDVTERRKADSVREAFLHAVSHDLRTPLTAVVGFADLLMKEDVASSPERVKEYAAITASHAQRLKRLLTDLLDLDRISRGVLQAQRRPTDMQELVDRVVEGVDLSSRNMRVTVNANVREVNIDPAQVERIIENLLVNLSRHTPDNTDCWVKVQRSPNGILILVEDSGPGIPEGLAEELFEPFRRADESEHSPGSGIGLSLVERFAQAHGGRAWVQNREGGGASFRVLLRES